MKIGAENKKSVYALMVFGPIAAYLVYANFFSGPSYKPVTPQPTRGDNSVTVPTGPGKESGPDISQAKEATARPGATRSKTGEFHPVLRSKKKEEHPVDFANIDPTIRFDLLAKVMKVPPAGGERDLFQILKTPPIKETAKLSGPEPNVYRFVGPRQPPPPPTIAPKVEPPPTPIPLRYYGYSALHPDGKRTAYFLIASPDGDEILEAGEGALLKGRYRIVQIGLDKVLVEDTMDKRRQPLNIEKEVTG